ncbi:MAG: hypothetical protein EAZ09_08820 [Oscillatoriales cyanobacterium]|nr:MAG: hypothetical protein EAZ18_08140 [Oscillatoriales cyanobacterium]TAH22978.1 MAG: hypothetical protein EAZ09_08820 [Oscillatoriales cyanobacterium]
MGRRKKEEGRRKKEEGRRKREEGRGKKIFVRSFVNFLVVLLIVKACSSLCRSPIIIFYINLYKNHLFF